MSAAWDASGKGLRRVVASEITAMPVADRKHGKQYCHALLNAFLLTRISVT
jgi:hypothetical protein